MSVAVLALVCLLALPPQEVPPPPELVAQLAAFQAQQDDPRDLLPAVATGLAHWWLQPESLATLRGGPLPGSLRRLDPDARPLVVFKMTGDRLPAAFVIAHHRGVLPTAWLTRQDLPRLLLRHPLVAAFVPVSPQRALLALDMPRGAELFGLQPSCALVETRTQRWPNGVVLVTTQDVEPTPREFHDLRTFRDRRRHLRHLFGATPQESGDCPRMAEYRTASLLLPMRGADGAVRDTLQVWFVRVTPAHEAPLVATTALWRWLLDHAAPLALHAPMDLTAEATGVTRQARLP